MGRFWKQGMVVLALAAAVGLWCLSPSLAAKPGGGSGGLVNPAWVIVDRSSVSASRLLSSDGPKGQDILRSKAYRPFPVRPGPRDGKWIASTKAESDGTSIRVVRPDGSGERVIYSFPRGDESMPDGNLGLQWVPGEVDRVLYTGNDTNVYVLSAAAQNSLPAVVVEQHGFRSDLEPGHGSRWWLSGGLGVRQRLVWRQSGAPDCRERGGRRVRFGGRLQLRSGGVLT